MKNIRAPFLMVPLVPAGGKFDKRKGKSGRIEGVDNERERE